jgi:hypothetical protein
MAPLCSSGEGSTHRNARVSTRVASAARAAYLKRNSRLTWPLIPFSPGEVTENETFQAFAKEGSVPKGLGHRGERVIVSPKQRAGADCSVGKLWWQLNFWLTFARFALAALRRNGLAERRCAWEPAKMTSNLVSLD